MNISKPGLAELLTRICNDKEDDICPYGFIYPGSVPDCTSHCENMTTQHWLEILEEEEDAK